MAHINKCTGILWLQATGARLRNGELRKILVMLVDSRGLVGQELPGQLDFVIRRFPAISLQPSGLDKYGFAAQRFIQQLAGPTARGGQGVIAVEQRQRLRWS